MKKYIILFILTFLIFHIGLTQKPGQTIRGVVFDAKTHERLPGANVLLVKENTGTITNPDGQFILDGIPVGRYHLQVSYVGYEPVIIPELLVGSAKEVVLEIEMEQTFSELEEVVVKPTIRKDRPTNSMAGVSARTFSVEEAGRYAGALDDPGRMAGNFAGVTTAGVHVNAIVVRGNAPKGLSWRLEGVDIPVPSHFSGSNVAGGGGLTIFSSRLLANSDFYTGAFPAEFGNATAGVFDMKLRNGNNQKHEYALQIGVQGIEAAAEGPFNQQGGGSYLFNYRYSTMALIFPLLPEVKESGEIPVYQDLSFKINAPAGKSGTFSIWGIGGLSKTSMDGSDDTEEWIYPENRVKMSFHYNMGAGGITHSQRLGNNTFLRSTIALNAGEHAYHKSSRLNESNPDDLVPLYNAEITSGMVTFSTQLNHVFSSRFNLKGGIDATDHLYELNGDAMDFQTGSLASTMDGSGSSWLLKGHAQGKYYVSPDIFITAGINGSWFALNEEFSFEPRISANWQFNTNHSFSLGYGNHSQTEPLFVYFVPRLNSLSGKTDYPNKELDRMKAHHFVLGYDWSVNDYLRLKIEPYYQYLYDVPVVEGTSYSMINFLSDWTFDKMLVNKGTGSNKGVDITLERFLHHGYYYMTTASFYKSEYTGGDGVKRHSRYDGNYVINLLGGKEWLINEKNILGLNLKCTFMGPYWYHPVDEELTHQQGSIAYDENAPLNDRYSSLETISDFTISYRINRQNTSSVFTVQVRNIFGRQYQGKRYNVETRSIENEFFSSPVPFVSWKVEF